MTGTRSGQLLLVGATTFAAGLVLLLPARVLYHWAAPAALQVAGIEGSVWHGSAREAMVEDVYLRNIRWRMRPARLLTGEFAFSVSADPVNGFLEGDAALGLGATVSLRNLHAAVPLSIMQSVIAMQDASGELTLRIDEIVLEGGWPRELRGEAGLSNLLVRALAPTALGSFQAEFQTTDDAIVGTVEEVSGMLDVTGTLTLNSDRSYSLVGQVAPTAAATPSVVQQLSYLGTPDARGRREFRLEGTL